MTSHVVCQECRYVYEATFAECPTCGHAGREGPFDNKLLAEAKATGLWLADGYSMCDVKDEYFKPRR